jgi:predicted Ser/Thr protein kinase
VGDAPDRGRRYVVHEVLGSGGFGTVYRAELHTDDAFVKEVALKVLHPEEDRPEHLARLRDEARVLALVRHRALVGVDELLRLEGRPAVVMELVRGVPLEALVRSGPVPAAVALAVVAEVASALAAAWDAVQLVHRDVKPGNVLLTADGDVKLVDFGVARADFPAREARSRAVVLGTLPYLSPERLELVDLPAGDVFALGITLVELVSGTAAGPAVARPDAHAARVAELLAAVAAASPAPDPAALLTRMLSFDPEDRPTASEVEQACHTLAPTGAAELRSWAGERVPVAALRARASGDWSGRRFTGGSSSHGESPATFSFDEPLVAPPPAVPPPPRRRWLGWTAALGGLGLALGGGVTAAVVVALGVAALVVVGWALTGPIGTHACLSMGDEMEAHLRGVPAAPEVDEGLAIVERVRSACVDGQVGLVGADPILLEVQAGVRDGDFSPSDLERLRDATRDLPGP